jgi:ABC-type transporter Mla subunit MlaD
MRKKDDQSRKEQDELSAGIESLKVEPFSNTPVVNDEIKSFDSLLKQMQDETHQSEKILEDLKENAKNLEHIMDQVQNSASNLEASQTDLKSLSESVEAFLTNDELFEKISKNLD